MDVIWSPWRYAYIKGASEATRRPLECVFCTLQAASPDTDAERYILFRGRHNYIVLNIYPYISGHLMIVTYNHIAELAAADQATAHEMMDLAQRSQAILKKVYQPHGFNLGMNLGRAAGAGVAEHIHLHLMPRWIGDANFTTTIGETRVIPEALETTYEKLLPHF